VPAEMLLVYIHAFNVEKESFPTLAKYTDMMMRRVGARHNGSGGYGANTFLLYLFKMSFRKILLLTTPSIP
jgi:hypothetical protein